MQIIIGWSVLISVSFVVGVLVAKFWKRSYPTLVSGAVVWLIFLVVNVASEQVSSDYELIQGVWPLLQLTIGTVVAVFGMLGAFVFRKLNGVGVN